jgi:hypothetical protein
MTFQEELDYLRGSVPDNDKLIGLHPNPPIYVPASSAREAIDVFERRALACLALGEKLNPLEQLGLMLLRSAAGLSR